ncbi:MAG: hypothetical protein K6G92_04410 [Bacteroidaceae bacterium]|nr:hypothetical protein [Bacteroidaceae bacterium]
MTRLVVCSLASYPYRRRITIPIFIGLLILPAKEYYRSDRKDGTLRAKGKVACGGFAGLQLITIICQPSPPRHQNWVLNTHNNP